ncbi:aldose 1-epimerase family protein [Marasmitruncus massiliensis]|uniref:aldose 1-epimerase family protein n=1 Tax=Marasmitruncus massiliensis TaxID=1944642 RepID=UPI000C7D575C|nr:aldose 1-epimerase family protein [Marasmitruncus massiliensis]
MSQYQLKYGKATAAVNSIGGELASYVAANGREYIWGGDPAVWASHSPVLFPVVGTTIDGKVKIAGKEYDIQKHGFTRKLEFQPGKHGEDFVEYTLSSNPDLLKQYPFEFTLHVTHTICEDGFRTDFLVENQSDRRMPMCIGGHPGFNCPIRDGEFFEDYVLKFECVEHTENTLAPNGGCITGTEWLPEFTDTDTLALKHSLFDPRDALIFAGPKSRVVKLINAKTGKGLEFDFHKFDALGIWSAPNKNAPYVCLEPWCGLPAYQGETGNFEDKPYVRILEPGTSFQVGYSMKVID